MEDTISAFISGLKTAVLAGLGAGAVTKEKAEQAVNRLVKQGKLAAEDAQKLVNDLIESGEKQADDAVDRIKESIDKACASVGIIRAKDAESIQERLEKAEQRITVLEDIIDRSEG